MSSKVHVSLDVTNIEESARFYSVLFDMNPTKLKADYAKFDVENPAINLTMNKGNPCCVQGLNHMGIRVEKIEQVLAAKQRLESAGYRTSDEMGTTCCYAAQDKIWAKDPNGYRWEVYIFKGDTVDANAAESTCCAKQ
jgi:catechol 2,3-dioxygenase-like lactoylglutathione lyase family enzyme